MERMFQPKQDGRMDVQPLSPVVVPYVRAVCQLLGRELTPAFQVQ